MCIKPNQNYWLKQPMPGSVVPLAMFVEHSILSWSREMCWIQFYYVNPQNFTTSRNSNVMQAGLLQKLCGTVCFIAATFPSLPLSLKQLHLWFSADPCVARSALINIKNFWKSRILRTLRLFIKTTASLVLSRPVLPGRLIWILRILGNQEY